MRDLDAPETYQADRSGLALALRELVERAPQVPSSPRGPFEILASGEAWWPAQLIHRWLPERLGPGGLLLLEGALAKSPKLPGGVEVLRVGPSEQAEIRFESGPLAAYTYLSVALQLVGAQRELAEINSWLVKERERLLPEVPLDRNPAKYLAYTFLERMPLWIVRDELEGLAPALQQAFARIGKSLSLTPPPSPLEFFLTALEARHEQGDPLVAVLVGFSQPGLVRELVESRVDALAELVSLDPPSPLAESLGYWYRICWASYYLALLYGVDPGDARVLQRLRESLSYDGAHGDL